MQRQGLNPCDGANDWQLWFHALHEIPPSTRGDALSRQPLLILVSLDAEAALMNKPYVLWNLKQAREALERLIADMQADGDYGYGEFRVDMEHLYHHINTAWNARDASKESVQTRVLRGTSVVGVNFLKDG